jgi:membrane associated rhomboid family serine protease
MFIPMGVAGRSKYRPYMTFGLIAVNVFVFIITVLTQVTGGYEGMLHFYKTYALDICRIGAEPITYSIGKSISSMFLHAGLMHVLGNMVFLWIFAPRVEAYFGHKRFLILYLFTGIGAAVAHILVQGANICIPGVNVEGLVVGASGAVSGVMGAFLFLYPGSRVRTVFLLGAIPLGTFFVSAWVYLGFWFLMDLLNGFIAVSNVAHWAHVGGFIVGFVVAFVAGMYKDAPKQDPFEYLDD